MGSALFAVAGSLICFKTTRRAAYAEDDCGHAREITYNNFNTRNANLPPVDGLSLHANNIALNSAVAYSTDSLHNNTLYGEWSDTFQYYNCYAFALGRTDDFYKIGQFSNNIFQYEGFIWVNTIEELADYTVQDLCSTGLNYKCITKSKNTFKKPYTKQTLICVRKSKIDFHFMKYVDGEWLHKPGGSWILKYNSIPDVNENWISEAATMDLAGNIVYEYDKLPPYTGDIYFISYAKDHDNCYQYRNTNEHYVTCRYCSSSQGIKQHTFKRYFGKKPGKICTGCNYILYDDGTGQIIMKEDDEKI